MRNIRQLVTASGSDPAFGSQMRELRVVDRPVLVLRDERILAVETESRSPRADRVIDAAGGIVVPGLVDACAAAGRTQRGAPGAETVSDGDPRRLRIGLEAMLQHGTTSAEVRAGAPGAGERVLEILSDLHQLAYQVPLRLSTAFVGAPHDGAHSARADRISALIGDTIPSVSRRRLATTCVVLCGDGGYARKEARAVLRAAHGAGLTSKVQASGADGDAVLLAAECESGAIDHLSGDLPPRSLLQLRQAGTIATLLPAGALLGEGGFRGARGLVDAGLSVALGSAANLIEGGVYSLWTAVALLVRIHGLSVAEALVAATLNSAAAIGAANHVGTLEPGKQGDFVVLGIDDYRSIPEFVVGLPIRNVVVGGREVTRA